VLLAATAACSPAQHLSDVKEPVLVVESDRLELDYRDSVNSYSAKGCYTLDGIEAELNGEKLPLLLAGRFVFDTADCVKPTFTLPRAAAAFGETDTFTMHDSSRSFVMTLTTPPAPKASLSSPADGVVHVPVDATLPSPVISIDLGPDGTRAALDSGSARIALDNGAGSFDLVLTSTATATATPLQFEVLSANVPVGSYPAHVQLHFAPSTTATVNCGRSVFGDWRPKLELPVTIVVG
jgi:hypothetical protein